MPTGRMLMKSMLSPAFVLLCLAACGGNSSSSAPPAPVPVPVPVPAAAAPTITIQPADQTVVVGQPAMFAVTATGAAPLTYQWRKNGTEIAGATAASFT